MRILGVVAVVVLLTGPAYAQSLPNINLMPEVKSKTAEEKEAEAERDKRYRDSLRKIPDAKASSDPWGNMRGADTPRTSAKTSAPAKPRAKTGGTAN
jgi:hypothetical protein